MNTTEEEDQMPGNDVEIDAGVFAFPPSTFPINDTVQKVLHFMKSGAYGIRIKMNSIA